MPGDCKSREPYLYCAVIRIRSDYLLSYFSVESVSILIRRLVVKVTESFMQRGLG